MSGQIVNHNCYVPVAAPFQPAVNPPNPSDKVILWTSFVGNIPALQDRFAEFRPVTLYGEMDVKSRDAAVSAFKRDRHVRLLVANPAAAREGLTLTQARTAIYIDRTLTSSIFCNRRIGYTVYRRQSPAKSFSSLVKEQSMNSLISALLKSTDSHATRSVTVTRSALWI